ncbi:CotH kinase family protein [uncultured Lutibacter sp.]|uniref:CotH kinase family protein n=1 Tax=uncultured Lutibacter sp. TaxID=437739 RepID=UPI00260B656E|nr:CotH kinase family protein [uncultured Lutibacter sp.]
MSHKISFKLPNLKRHLYYLLIIVSVLLTSCSDDSPSIPPIIEGTELVDFAFLKVNNPSLSSDIYLNKVENTFKGRVSYSTDIKNLVATYIHNGLKVEVNNVAQEVGTTLNDFKNPVTFIVKTTDGREQNYEVDVTYFTGLPIVYLITDGNAAIDSKDDYREGDIIIEGGRNFIDFDETSMEIRGRGNSTWWLHPKKPYQMKLSNKTEVLGMPKDKKWIFLAEHSDKTLMRNTIAFEMGYLSKLDWTPKSEYAEVFVNNEYSGTYNISQKVEESSNRVDLGDTGYLLEIDQLERLDPDDVYFRTNDFLINIKEPDLEYGSTTFNYVKDLVNEFEIVLKSSDFKNPTSGYAKYIDVDSFIDWYLISEITKNQDSKSFSSIFLNVIPGEKIKMGPLWDFDLAFGNVNYSDATNPTGFWVKEHKWYARLFEDPTFVNKIKSRFAYFKNNQNLILNKMDFYANYLKYAQDENDIKWNTLGNYVWPNPVVYNTYEEEVDHLKTWYTTRMEWLDGAYMDL